MQIRLPKKKKGFPTTATNKKSLLKVFKCIKNLKKNLEPLLLYKYYF